MLSENKKYDIIIIGAGIAGATAAREFSKYKLSVAVLEKEADVCFGVTKGTNGIIHCGLSVEGMPLRNKAEVLGNKLLESVCKEIDVPFKRIGKLLVAFNQNEIDILKKIIVKSTANGVKEIELIEDKLRLKSLEPNLSDKVIGALYTKSTAVTSPWGLVIGLIENAIQNGVKLYLDTKVLNILKGHENKYLIETNRGSYTASYIINASGASADIIANMVGDRNFKLTGSKGERIILDKINKGKVKHLVRRLVGSHPFGDFICPTIDENVMIGCKVATVDLHDLRTTNDGIKNYILSRYKDLIPALNADTIIKPFSGTMPSTGGDYHVKSQKSSPNFVNMVLGGSGVTSSVYIAKYLVEEVMPSLGLSLNYKSSFYPYRKDITHFFNLSEKEQARIIDANPLFGKIVCRCECVSEGEIIEATKRGATTKDGIKFRTRAGMGRCQGNFCSHKVIEIIKRELKLNAYYISKKGNGSKELISNN